MIFLTSALFPFATFPVLYLERKIMTNNTKLIVVVMTNALMLLYRQPNFHACAIRDEYLYLYYARVYSAACEINLRLVGVRA